MYVVLAFKMVQVVNKLVTTIVIGLFATANIRSVARNLQKGGG